MAIDAHRLTDEPVERDTRLLLQISDDPPILPDEDVLRGVRMRDDRSLNDADRVEPPGALRRGGRPRG